MGVPVALTRQAREDIGEIIDFIARDNPDRAETFGDALVLKALSLDKQPWRGRVVPEFGNRNLREILQGVYRIIDRVTDEPERVFVLRFWHGARGTPRIVED